MTNTSTSPLLTYRTGDATDPDGPEPKIICHVCNDVGAWGRGFVLALSRRWPEPERSYRRWWGAYDRAHLPLGEVQLVEAAPRLWVANMIAQHGIHGTDGRPPIRYDALARCLRRVREHALELGAGVHMPRIGTGLAGGDWSRVSAVVVEEICAHDVPVTVYDLPATPSRRR